MIEFTPKHRQVFSEKNLDMGNIAAAALIFGQFVSEKPLNWTFAVLGITILFVCYLISYLLLKGE